MATLLETLKERTAALRAPIPGANPGGIDVSFETDFEKVKLEIDKLTSMGGGKPNWEKVAETSAAILTTQSKDIRLAIWSTVAKTIEGDWAGFAEGLVVYQALIHDFWTTMYPDLKRARGRANLHAWMTELTFAHLDAKPMGLADAEAVLLCDSILKDVDSILVDKLGEAYAGNGRLQAMMLSKARAASDLIEEANRPPPPEVEEQAATPESVGEEGDASEEAPAAAFTPQAMASPEDAAEGVRVCADQIKKAAALLRELDPADWWSYHLNRVGAWLTLKGPPADYQGRTDEQAPAEEVKPAIEALVQEEKWQELLAEAEKAASATPFWLDAHRYVAMALERLGSPYREAREVVGRAVASLVNRYPTVTDLLFFDQSPFCDAVTAHWVHAERIKWGAITPAAAAWSAEDDAIEQRFVIARQMLAGRKIADGLSLAVALAKRAGDARTRFRAHLTAARLAIEADKASIARPILEGLLPQVDEYKLETWEPDLCGTLYRYLVMCIRASKEPVADAEQKEAVLIDKLCRIDPAAAIKLARVLE